MLQVEQSVQVYLVLTDDGRWIVDPMLVRQQQLDGYDGGAELVCAGHPDGEECGCGDKEGPYDGEVPALPTLDELIAMITTASTSPDPCAYCGTYPLASQVAAGPWNWPGKGAVVNCKRCAGIRKCPHGVEYDSTDTLPADACNECMDVEWEPCTDCPTDGSKCTECDGAGGWHMTISRAAEGE